MKKITLILSLLCLVVFAFACSLGETETAKTEDKVETEKTKVEENVREVHEKIVRYRKVSEMHNYVGTREQFESFLARKKDSMDKLSILDYDDVIDVSIQDKIELYNSREKKDRVFVRIKIVSLVDKERDRAPNDEGDYYIPLETIENDNFFEKIEAN